MTLNITLLVICLVLSGFFSSSETALFSISRIKAFHVAKDGSKTGELIVKMKQDPHTLLTTILIGNNLVNIGGAALATSIAITYFQSNAVGIATGVMTLVILVFGEIFPKAFATQYNVMVARVVIFPLYWLSRLFWPLVLILNFIPRLYGSVNPAYHTVTEDELMTMVEVVEEEGEIKEAEKEYITNIFEFDDTSCCEIMTPRADMFVVDAMEELDIPAILSTGYSRIPVIEDSIDNVIGVLHIKDLFASYQKLTASDEQISSLDIKTIMKKPYFIPESKKLDSLLQEFKAKKKPYGHCGGRAWRSGRPGDTGGRGGGNFRRIIDETDQMVPDIVRLKDNKWLVAGRINVEDLNKEIDINIPESVSYDTFSGFFLEQIDRIPQPGESVIIDRWTATVKEMDGNRIQSFIVKKEGGS